MADTTFTDGVTPIVSSWLNDIDKTCYVGLGNSQTKAGARTYLGTQVKEIADATDIALQNIASSYTAWANTATATIPTSGFIRGYFTGRVLDAGTVAFLYFGVRINGINYWFGDFNANGTINHTSVISTAGGSSYKEVLGAIPSGSGGIMSGINISANGIATGSQVITPIVAGSTSGGTLKGTIITSRIQLEIVEAI